MNTGFKVFEISLSNQLLTPHIREQVPSYRWIKAKIRNTENIMPKNLRGFCMFESIDEAQKYKQYLIDQFIVCQHRQYVIKKVMYDKKLYDAYESNHNSGQSFIIVDRIKIL